MSVCLRCGSWLVVDIATSAGDGSNSSSNSDRRCLFVAAHVRASMLPWLRLLSVWMEAVYDSMFLAVVLTSLGHESLRSRLVKQTWEPVAMTQRSSVLPLVMGMSWFFLAPVLILVVAFHSGSGVRRRSSTMISLVVIS